jgi:hypothetical protein
MPRYGLLSVQDQFRPRGGARGRKCQAGLLPGRLVRPGIGSSTVQRQHRQASELCDAARDPQPKHAAQSGAILSGQGSKNRWEIDWRKSPFRHQSDRARPTQEAAHFRRAKTRVDVDGKRTKPRAGKDCG